VSAWRDFDTRVIPPALKVLALTRYGPLAASSRIRCYQYVPALRAQGVDVHVVRLLSDEYVRAFHAGGRRAQWRLLRWYGERLRELLRARRYDVLWIAHEMFPGFPATAERILARSGPPYVVELDDALFHRYDLNPSWLTRRFLGRKIDVVMARAGVVIAGNEYLAERARSAGARHVALLPSVVDLQRYVVLPEQAGPFTIGWIGSPTTATYLGLIRTSLEQAYHRGARLVAVGARRAVLPDLPFETHEWNESTEVSEIARFDVGVMPLGDGPWEQGKCGYKLIQYMACGRPVVASAVGANRHIVQHGETGFLAETEAEWTEALTRLAGDRALRERMGRAGRQDVERRYSLHVTTPVLAGLLARAAGRTGD
jgi:glycosyltransferase involved in cell wall biosynthesis